MNEDKLGMYKEMVRAMRFKAFTDPWNGDPKNSHKINNYRMMVPAITDPNAMLLVIMTFDVGHHNCGWWKNSQYDRCLHFSISVCGEKKGRGIKCFNEPQEPTMEEINTWVKLVFEDLHPDAMKWLWYEPGVKTKAIHHIRLFYSKVTGEPILPIGEVYTLKPWDDGTSPEKIFSR